MAARSSVREPTVPTGWRAVQLAQVARIHGGGRLGLTKGDYVPSGVRAYSAAGQDGRVVHRESIEPAVILSSIGARCGKCFLALEPWTTLANTQAIIPEAAHCDATFLHAYVNSEAYWFRSGSAQPFIAPSTVKQAWVSLPPLPEQRKIAAILSSVDETIEKTEAVIEQLQVVKKAMMEELLTRGMPGRHTRFKQTEIGEVPEGWEVVELDEVADVQTGIAKGKQAVPGARPVPYLRVANLQDQFLDLRSVKTIEATDEQVGRYSLRDGDVLFCEGGDADKVGRGSVWRSERDVCLHQNHVFAVRPRAGVLASDFLSIYRSSKRGRRYFLDCAKQTTNLASINSTQLKAFPLPMPPVEEQRAIVNVVAAVAEAEAAERTTLTELRAAKSALSAALLSGDLRVTPDEAAP